MNGEKIEKPASVNPLIDEADKCEFLLARLKVVCPDKESFDKRIYWARKMFMADKSNSRMFSAYLEDEIKKMEGI